MSKVWLIMPDGGCEGLSEPIAAFASEADARWTSEVIDKAHGSCHRIVGIEVQVARPEPVPYSPPDAAA